LTNDNQNLAIWLDKDDEGNIKISVAKDGEYAGTVVDFNNQLGFKQNWFVYIIKCRKSKGKHKGEIQYYTGQTWNLKKRFREHRNGIGSKWIKNNNFTPLKVVYFERVDTESKSLKREQEIKNWSHDKKKRKGQEFFKKNKQFIEGQDLSAV